MDRPDLRESNWECANASGCSGSSSSGYLKPRPVLARANPVRQKKHKKLRKLMVDGTVDLWVLDEVHFQQVGLRCRMWVPPETKGSH